MAEYDPQQDTGFSLAAYAFAFWRLCRQPITTTSRHLHATAGPGDDRSDPHRLPPLDRVRIVRLRPAPAGPAHAGPDGRGYHHRWPVRVHKVRQFYPSTGTHKVIWRGPYIKGPDGAPRLIGPKAQAAI